MAAGADWLQPWGQLSPRHLSKDGWMWVKKPGRVGEVGCIHTCQGLELETIGVIIVPDLACRDGQVVKVPSARACTDQWIDCCTPSVSARNPVSGAAT